MILPLAIAYWATGLLVGGFLIVCVILMLVVLIQRPQGGGLSGAFGAGGSGGAGQTAFGTKTGDALTFATIGMFILYLLFAIGLNFATRPENIDHAQVPSITSTNPVETTESGPLTTEGTVTDDVPVSEEGATDLEYGDEGVADDAASEPAATEPAPTDPPATDPAPGETPPGL